MCRGLDPASNKGHVVTLSPLPPWRWGGKFEKKGTTRGLG